MQLLIINSQDLLRGWLSEMWEVKYWLPSQSGNTWAHSVAAKALKKGRRPLLGWRCS
ncbi:hypothetical protein Golob_020136 [Gossypium lobatum]|uniref:Uncharacterized protein n=1 Tax=Gossypium lobatum TaxID=34289 RepID=A0A7J8L9J1_9ROSI|nr:hypothetical protein [Gossypium lobatum]